MTKEREPAPAITPELRRDVAILAEKSREYIRQVCIEQGLIQPPDPTPR